MAKQNDCQRCGHLSSRHAYTNRKNAKRNRQTLMKDKVLMGCSCCARGAYIPPVMGLSAQRKITAKDLEKSLNEIRGD